MKEWVVDRQAFGVDKSWQGVGRNRGVWSPGLGRVDGSPCGAWTLVEMRSVKHPANPLPTCCQLADKTLPTHCQHTAKTLTQFGVLRLGKPQSLAVVSWLSLARFGSVWLRNPGLIGLSAQVFSAELVATID